MKPFLVSVLVLLGCGGCISLALERSTGNLRAIAVPCVQAPLEQITILDRADTVTEVQWTAQAGDKTCRCVQRTISETAGVCTAVARSQP